MTTKWLAFETVKAELLWFLEGGRLTGGRLDENRLRELMGRSSDQTTAWTIWTEDTNSKRWLPYAKFPGDCGRIYGAQWRSWRVVDGSEIDQLAGAIEAIKGDPWDRQKKIITARNVGELGDMCLPPCHE